MLYYASYLLPLLCCRSKVCCAVAVLDLCAAGLCCCRARGEAAGVDKAEAAAVVAEDTDQSPGSDSASESASDAAAPCCWLLQRRGTALALRPPRGLTAAGPAGPRWYRSPPPLTALPLPLSLEMSPGLPGGAPGESPL